MGLVATSFYTLSKHISIFRRFHLSYKAQKGPISREDRHCFFCPAHTSGFSHWQCSAEHAQTKCLYAADSKIQSSTDKCLFSLPSIKCSAAPPSFRLCCLNCTQRFDLITARSAVVGSWEEPPNIWLTVAKNTFVGWALNFRLRMVLKGEVGPQTKMFHHIEETVQFTWIYTLVLHGQPGFSDECVILSRKPCLLKARVSL